MDGNPPDLFSPCDIRRNIKISSAFSSDVNSPEFEFWRVTDRSSTQPIVNLISADELFHDGVLLPLHFLHLKPDPGPPLSGFDPPAALVPEPETTVYGHELSRETASKRWSGLFRKSENKSPAKNREKNRKREKKTGSGPGPGSGIGPGLSAAAELNINIWPFSRSRSASNTMTRPRISFGAPTTRKISSAPCSRSNSAGESKSRKWPNSPVRGGVHLGRSSPVWQVRRGDPTGKAMSGRVGERIGEGRRGKTVNEQSKPKILNLNVPVSTGSRSRLSCRKDESEISNSTVSANTLFGFRNLFIKKVH